VSVNKFNQQPQHLHTRPPVLSALISYFHTPELLRHLPTDKTSADGDLVCALTSGLGCSHCLQLCVSQLARYLQRLQFPASCHQLLLKLEDTRHHMTDGEAGDGREGPHSVGNMSKTNNFVASL